MGKRLILIALALLLLGGAAAAYLLLRPQATEAAAAAAPPGPGQFVALEPITLPVLRAGAVTKHVTFRITIELGAGRGAAELSPSLPRLQDAMLTELQALLSVDWPGESAINLAYAKRRLLDRGRRLLGADMVAGVLFQQVQERRL